MSDATAANRLRIVSKARLEPGTIRRPLSVLVRRSRTALPLLAGIALWELVARVFDLSVYLLPSPTVVVERFAKAPGPILSALLVTTSEALLGFLIAAVAGVLLGIVIARSAAMEAMLYPYLNIIRITPIVAIAPLLAIWFGHGRTPIVVMTSLIAFFPIVVAMVLGLRSADRDLINLMKILGASQLSVLYKIQLPTALPYLFASFRVSAPLAVIGALVGEFVSGSAGIGYLLVVAQGRIDTPLVFVAVVLSCVLGLAFFGLVVATEKRFVRWHPAVAPQL